MYSHRHLCFEIWGSCHPFPPLHPHPFIKQHSHRRISLNIASYTAHPPDLQILGVGSRDPRNRNTTVDAYMSIHYRSVGLLLGHLRRSATLVSFSFNKGSSSKNGCIPHCKLQYTATYSYPAVWHSKTLPRIHFLWLPM